MLARVGAWAHVEKLFLNQNKLASLPLELKGCLALEKLYVDSNCLTSLPESLCELKILTGVKSYIIGHSLVCLV